MYSTPDTALLCPQIGATPLEFKQNQLKAGRLSSMRALMLNYECSLHGLMRAAFITFGAIHLGDIDTIDSFFRTDFGIFKLYER